MTGELDDRRLVDLLVARPRVGPVRGHPAVAAVRARPATRRPAALDRLVAAYGPGRDVTALLRALLTDPDFRAPATRGALVAAPVEYVAGSYRSLGLRPPRDDRTAGPGAAGALTRLGQVPFRPPSVGGWPAGTAWLSTAATRARLELRPRRRPRPPTWTRSPGAARGSGRTRWPGCSAWTAWTARTRGGARRRGRRPRRLVTLALVSPEHVTARTPASSNRKDARWTR